MHEFAGKNMWHCLADKLFVFKVKERMPFERLIEKIVDAATFGSSVRGSPIFIPLGRFLEGVAKIVPVRVYGRKVKKTLAV